MTGAQTDGTEQGKVPWVPVTGRAENAPLRLPFEEVGAPKHVLQVPDIAERAARCPSRGSLPLGSQVVRDPPG